MQLTLCCIHPQARKALDGFRCPPKVSGRCLVVDVTCNRVNKPYIPKHEARDDLEVIVTDLSGGDQEWEAQRKSTTSNRVLHRQKSELQEGAGNQAGEPGNQPVAGAKRRKKVRIARKGRTADRSLSEQQGSWSNSQASLSGDTGPQSGRTLHSSTM